MRQAHGLCALAALLSLALSLPRAARGGQIEDEALSAGQAEAARGAYREAIEAYEAAADRGARHPNLSYNRAMAYLARARQDSDKPGDLGQAAAALEESLWLRPREPEAERALELVRAEVARRRSRGGGPMEVMTNEGASRAVASLLSETSWALCALGSSLVLAAGLLLRRHSLPRLRLSGGVASVLGLLALLLTAPLTAFSREVRRSTATGVVVVPEARLLDERGMPRPGPPLPEAARVDVHERRGALVRVTWGALEGFTPASNVRIRSAGAGGVTRGPLWFGAGLRSILAPRARAPMAGPGVGRGEADKVMRLVIASEEQKAQRDRVTHAAWGAPLDMEQFALRERRLRAHCWTRGSMTTWLLVGDGDEVLSSCETFRMPSAIEGRERASSYGVASVFTEERHRGKGYATRMMDALGEAVQRSDPSAHAMLLFSDVGPGMYARSGYVPRPAFDWSLRPETGHPLQAADTLFEEAALSLPDPPRAPFVVWPSVEQVDWHLERERTYAELLGRSRPAWCGARKGRSLVVWAADFRRDRLNVLLVDVVDPSDLAPLLSAARRVASMSRLNEVVAWEDAQLARLGPPPEVARRPRPDSLPMLCPLDPRVKPASWDSVMRALWV